MITICEIEFGRNTAATLKEANIKEKSNLRTVKSKLRLIPNKTTKVCQEYNMTKMTIKGQVFSEKKD